MNSKVLQNKIDEVERDILEMKLLKRGGGGGQNLEEENNNIVCSTSSSMISLKHYDTLLCDLKCPGCSALLQAPIYLCISGHSICRLCRISLKNCPVCHDELTSIRSFTLERLCGKFQFPCKNLRNGCHARFPLELMSWHEEKCTFKKTLCFMGKIWHDCEWKGRETDWMTHCERFHATKILKGKESFDLVWNYETLKDNAGPVVAYYLIQNFGETYNLYQIHDVKQKSLTWTIILANHFIQELRKPDHNLPKFCFEFEFYHMQDPSYLLIQRFPVHYEDSEEVLDDGKCVKVLLSDIERFLDPEKNLHYRVKILSSSCKSSKDKWDEVLDKTINEHKMQQQEDFDNLQLQHSHHEQYDKFSDKFDYFDSTPSSDDKTTVVLRKSPRPEDDSLKQIYDKEFGQNYEESRKLIQKPPRKSLEMRRSWEPHSNLSENSFNF